MPFVPRCQSVFFPPFVKYEKGYRLLKKKKTFRGGGLKLSLVSNFVSFPSGFKITLRNESAMSLSAT